METIPVDKDTVLKLVRLGFAWDLSPEDALKRALDEALERQS